MLNTTVPFKNLINGGLAMTWLSLLILVVTDSHISAVVSYIDNHENIAVYAIPLFALLAYSLGIAVTSISFRLAHIVLYKWFVFGRNGYSKADHGDRYINLQLVGNENVLTGLRYKSEELSILGGCWLNSIPIAVMFVCPV